MTFRIATLNLEQDHKRWSERQELVLQQLDQVRPDIDARLKSVNREQLRWGKLVFFQDHVAPSHATCEEGPRSLYRGRPCKQRVDATDRGEKRTQLGANS